MDGDEFGMHLRMIGIIGNHEVETVAREFNGAVSVLKQNLDAATASCDECDGGGTYYISGKARDCVCMEPFAAKLAAMRAERDALKQRVDDQAVAMKMALESLEGLMKDPWKVNDARDVLAKALRKEGE